MILLGIICGLLWFRIIYVQSKYDDPHPITWSFAYVTAIAFFGLLIARNWGDIKEIIIFLTAF